MHHHLSLRSKLIIMISVMASFFLVTLDQTIISTALGKIVEEFDSFSSLAWIFTAYLITTTITIPIAGKFSDVFGRRNMLIAGVLIFTIGSFLSGTSGSIEQLILWRAVQGIGGGILIANAFTIIGDLFAARERGKWQGVVGAVLGVASIVGPLLGGFLTEAHTILGLTTDWRWTFFINVPVGIVVLVIIAIFCPPLKRESKPRVDYLGAALLAIALATLVLAVDNTDKIFAGVMESTGISLSTLRIVMFSVVAVATAAFIVVERRTKEPILHLGFFKNRNFILLTIIATLIGASMLGSILYLTQFNQQVFNASPTQSGLMLIPMIVGLLIMSITSGQIVSKTGRYKHIMTAGFIIGTIAIASLLLLTPESSYLQEVISIVFIGIGLGASIPILNVAIQNEFEQQYLGVVTGSNQLFRGLGSTIGVAIFGGMLTVGITNVLGDMNRDSYIEALKQSPEASQMVTDITDADTLLNLNTGESKQRVNDSLGTNLEASPLPVVVREKIQQDMRAKQEAYSNKIVDAFSRSLHQIFIVTSLLMLAAGVLSLALEERALRTASADETPGEA